MSEKTKPNRRWLKPLISGTALIAACGIASAGSGPITTHVRSSGGTCSTSYQHIWVTVKDVTAHMGRAGWQDLTPGLSSAPIQVDLLNEASTDCFLATLGQTSGLPAGKYQQIRFILADGNGHGKGKKGGGGGTGPSPNACASLSLTTYNCIDLGGGSLVPISLSSEGRTGIKIPPGQIAHGGLVISDGQGADLDIDFNACKSIVKAGKSGQYKLKPTLHAGEIDLSALVAGNVVLGTDPVASVTPATPAVAVPGANLWLESQPVAANFTVGSPSPAASPTPTVSVENVVATATSDANGHFEFCPVPAGSYELVADSGSMPVTGNASNATITTGVTVTSTGGPNNLVIPLLDDGTSAALLEGLFTTTNSVAFGDDIAFGGVQSFGGAVQAVIPPLSGTIPAAAPGTLPSVTTIDTPTGSNCPNISPSCPGGTVNCECFTLALPASNPVVGAWSAGGTTYAAPALAPVDYAVLGSASQISSPSTPECVPSDLITDPSLPIAVTGGTFTEADNPTSLTLPTLSFTGCD